MVKNCDQLTSFFDHDPFINQQKVMAVLLDYRLLRQKAI